MRDLKERMLKNSGVSILTESNVNEKLKELEIKERAERIISSFQREVLGLAKYINDGCMYPYSREEVKLDDETCEKYKKLVCMFLTAKMESFKSIIVDSFGGSADDENDNDDEGNEGDEKEVTVSVAEVPQVQMAHPMEKHSNFNY